MKNMSINQFYFDKTNFFFALKTNGLLQFKSREARLHELRTKKFALMLCNAVSIIHIFGSVHSSTKWM